MGFTLGSRDQNMTVTKELKQCSTTADLGFAEFGTYLKHQWQLPPWLQGKEVLSQKPKAQPGCSNTSGSLLYPLLPLQHLANSTVPLAK